jgi:acyl-CoA thioesterase-1
MWPFRLQPARRPRDATPRSYGKRAGAVQTFARACAFTIAWLACAATPTALGAAERPVKIVALGDSLTAGLGLPSEAAFPAKLAQALRDKGITVEVANAGVSGDTSADGLSRIDWSVPEGADAAIVELGANDALRGIDPRLTRAAIEAILRRLRDRNIAVLLAGMRAPPNMGAAYAQAFDPIFPELASRFDVVFYPFFLDGVAAERALNQPDGMHPTAAGIDVIVAHILPKVEELIARARKERGS